MSRSRKKSLRSLAISAKESWKNESDFLFHSYVMNVQFLFFFFTYSVSIRVSHATKQQSTPVVPAVLVGSYDFSAIRNTIKNATQPMMTS